MFVKFTRLLLNAHPVVINKENISTITPVDLKDYEAGTIIRTTAKETIEVQEPFDEVIYRICKDTNDI